MQPFMEPMLTEFATVCVCVCVCVEKTFYFALKYAPGFVNMFTKSKFPVFSACLF